MWDFHTATRCKCQAGVVLCRWFNQLNPALRKDPFTLAEVDNSNLAINFCVNYPQIVSVIVLYCARRLHNVIAICTVEVLLRVLTG